MWRFIVHLVLRLFYSFPLCRFDVSSNVTMSPGIAVVQTSFYIEITHAHYLSLPTLLTYAQCVRPSFPALRKRRHLFLSSSRAVYDFEIELQGAFSTLICIDEYSVYSRWTELHYWRVTFGIIGKRWIIFVLSEIICENEEIMKMTNLGLHRKTD